MGAALKRAAATPSATHDLFAHGYHVLKGGVDAQAATALLRRITAQRRFDESLFLTEAEFDAAPQFTGVNPRPGRNLLERYERDLAFVEQDFGLTAALADLLGDGYEILLKKLICGVPEKSMPAWLKARIAGDPVNNLGPYVRPEHRDVTYFYGIDFHQDLIDHPDREADFVTLYVYLHDVGPQDAPLFLLEGSHALGGTLFPHDLTDGPEGWTYRDGRGGRIETGQHRLTGPAGFAALWHPCTLHGTQPDAADHARLSLRYLIARRPGVTGTGIDAVNATLHGPLSLTATRRDLDARGAAAIKANSVNRA